MIEIEEAVEFLQKALLEQCTRLQNATAAADIDEMRGAIGCANHHAQALHFVLRGTPEAQQALLTAYRERQGVFG